MEWGIVPSGEGEIAARTLELLGGILSALSKCLL